MSISVYTENRRQKIEIKQDPFQSGGEGNVHKIVSPRSLRDNCVKIYKDKTTRSARKRSAKEAKISFMTQNRPGSLRGEKYQLCWPTDAVYEKNDAFCGFMMPLASSGSESLYLLCRSDLRKLSSAWDKFSRSTKKGLLARLKVCVNLAVSVHKVHSSNDYTLVDLKPNNLLVTPKGDFSVIDLDSLQVSRNGNVLHPAQAATPEYMPPEAASITSVDNFIAETWDRFSLAVIIYKVLIGVHPFAGTGTGKYDGVDAVQQKIYEGLFPFGPKAQFVKPFPTQKRFQKLPPPLRNAFERAFVAGHQDRWKRPSAEEWGQLLFNQVKGRQGGSSQSPKGSSTSRSRSSNSSRQKRSRKRQSKTKTKTKSSSGWKKVAEVVTIALGALLVLGVLLTWAEGGEELNSAEAYVERSHDLSVDGEIDERVALLEKGIEAYPQSQEIRSQLLDAYITSAHAKIGTKDYEEAIAVLEKASAKYPDKDEIEELLRKAREQTPEPLESVVSRAKRLFNDGRQERASELLKSAVANNPNKAAYRYQYGVFLLINAKHYEEAIAPLKKAVELKPNYAIAWARLGVAYKRIGQEGKAIARLKKSIELNPNLAVAHYDLGSTYVKMGQNDKAVSPLRRAVELKSNLSTWHLGGVYRNLGLAYMGMGQDERARTSLKKAVELRSDDPAAQIYLGVSYIRLGQNKNAISALKKAIDLKSNLSGRNLAVAYYNSGLAYKNTNRYKEAILRFRKAVEKRANYMEAHYQLGQTYMKAERYEEAVDPLNRAYNLNEDEGEERRFCRSLTRAYMQTSGGVAGCAHDYDFDFEN